MKYFFLLAASFAAQLSFAQYRIDSSLRERYWTLFERLPELIRNGKDTSVKKGLGILVELAADTLNKKDRRQDDVSVKIHSVDPGRDGQEGSGSTGEYGWIGDSTPLWLDCRCGFRGDTLEVVNGLYLFSGFSFTTRLANGRATAFYSGQEPGGRPFKTKLSGKRVDSFTVPATVSGLVLDRRPRRGMSEIYGAMSLTSEAYYSYSDASDFRYGYIHQRMHIRFYFHCRPAPPR